MTGVGRQVHRTDAHDDSVAINFLLKLYAFGDGVVHAILHEAAVLHVVHIVRCVGGFVLGRKRAGEKQAREEDSYSSHGRTLVRLTSSALLHPISILDATRPIEGLCCAGGFPGEKRYNSRP